MGRGQAETTQDMFAGVLGRRRGAKREGEVSPGEEVLRALVSAIRGPSLRLGGDDGEFEGRPVCSTTCFRGMRGGIVGWEVEGRLLYAPDMDEWVGAICSGTLGSKRTYPVAKGKALEVVLSGLEEAVDDAVGGRGRDAPMRPSGGARVLSVEDVRLRVEQARGLGLLPLA